MGDTPLICSTQRIYENRTNAVECKNFLEKFQNKPYLIQDAGVGSEYVGVRGPWRLSQVEGCSLKGGGTFGSSKYAEACSDYLKNSGVCNHVEENHIEENEDADTFNVIIDGYCNFHCPK